MFKISNILHIFGSIFGFLSKIFAKKTIVLISKNKIRNFEISPIVQVAVFAFSIFVANLFYESTIYNEIITEKSDKISHLRKINNKFQQELVAINGNLDRINEYFMSSSNYEDNMDNNEDFGLHDAKFDQIIADLNLEANYEKTAIELASANLILDNIKNLANKRISHLESKLAKTGLSLNADKLNKNNSIDDELVAFSLNTEDELSKQGGPLELESEENIAFNKSIDLKTADIDDEISYLANLEKFIYHAPLGKPMADYYVSSSFGKRIDPIKKVRAKHNGMDFVGQRHAEVLSPSIGKVKLAGRFGAYGNTVVIDHGYGITSRYGHLYKVKVKKGDIVKKGDVLGLQGTSGRSTGSHLHYEVRYNNSPLNPRKFLKTGNNIFDKKDI